jgi:hypothetical protein
MEAAHRSEKIEGIGQKDFIPRFMMGRSRMRS